MREAHCPACRWILEEYIIIINPNTDLFDKYQIVGYRCKNKLCGWYKK